VTNGIQYGESTTRETLPDEVLLRVMRRADAEQNRYVNLARIADALGGPDNTSHSLTRRTADALERIADALDRAYPLPVEEPGETGASS